MTNSEHQRQHVEDGTSGVFAANRKRAAKVYCKRGHNRWGRQKNGRRCLECHRLKQREYLRQKKAH